MSKPIFRWNVENMSNLGFDILKTATEQAIKVLGKNSFDWYIHHQYLPEDKVQILEDIVYGTPIHLYECDTYEERLAGGIHEIIVKDTAFIIMNRYKEIDEYLNRPDFYLDLAGYMTGIPPKDKMVVPMAKGHSKVIYIQDRPQVISNITDIDWNYRSVAFTRMKNIEKSLAWNKFKRRISNSIIL